MPASTSHPMGDCYFVFRMQGPMLRPPKPPMASAPPSLHNLARVVGKGSQAISLGELPRLFMHRKVAANPTWRRLMLKVGKSSAHNSPYHITTMSHAVDSIKMGTWSSCTTHHRVTAPRQSYARALMLSVQCTPNPLARGPGHSPNTHERRHHDEHKIVQHVVPPPEAGGGAPCAVDLTHARDVCGGHHADPGCELHALGSVHATTHRVGPCREGRGVAGGPPEERRAQRRLARVCVI